jgi:NAD(P)-dependent dehydrogenase (short-subunit alcohol dehydrogenase family)
LTSSTVDRSGRVALVTGANRGIGLAIANGLANRGYRVILSARKLTEAEAAARQLGSPAGEMIPMYLDVADPRSIDGARQRVEHEVGRIEALVNNAGADYDEDELPSTVDLELARHALNVNAMGPWRTCQAFIPLMRSAGYGRIVNVSSGPGSFQETAGPEAPAYSVSKAALNMLTLKLALELRGTGVLVNAVCPGWVRTRMGGPAPPRSPEEGANTAIWLATLPGDGPTGGFFRDRQPIAW